jgi:integrase
MECTIKQINQLVESIRSGQPPELVKREEHYHDPALPGLYIRLLKTGVANWTQQWTRLGRQKKIKIGDVLVFDRMQAIKAGRELLAKITLDQLDPQKAKKERMAAAKITLAATVPLFFLDRKQNGEFRATTERLWNNILTNYYFKPLHNLPLDEITKQQLQTCIDTIAVRAAKNPRAVKGGKGAAKNAHTAMKVFFKWALEHGYLPEDHPNPIDRVKAPRQKSRERVLNDDEIRLLWNTCEDWKKLAASERQLRATTGRGTRPEVNGDFPCAVQLLFLTACRAGEIGELKRGEFDLDNAEMLIPGSRTKNKNDLCVPLSSWAVQILRSADQQAKELRPTDDHLFAHTAIRYESENKLPPWKALGMNRTTWYQKGKPPAPVVPLSSSRAMDGGCRNHPGLHLPGVNGEIDRRIARAGGIPPVDWTIHDIRRTVRTRLAALGVTNDVAEALLGHSGNRPLVVRTYNRYDYWPEKRNAVAMWEANLRAIIDGTAEKIIHPRFGERKKEGGTT